MAASIDAKRLFAKAKDRLVYSDFHRVFNFKTEEHKGASILLINTALSNIANAVVSGTLYTAFLVANGIDIVKVGIITFIPYMTWALSIFSPMIMSHFKKRRAVLLFNSVFYYTCVVLATTVMPMLVKGAGAKTACFAVFLFLGNLSNALLGSGATAWHLHFIPQGRDRNVYVSYTTTFSVVLSTATALIASSVAQSLSGGGHQIWILFWLRIASFVMFVGNALMVYLIPVEYPYAESATRLRFTDLFSKPLREKNFAMTTLFCIFWGIGCNLNAGTWNVYLLDTLGFPMWYPYVGSVVCAVGLIFLSTLVRRFIDKKTEFRSAAIFLSVLMMLEFGCTFITKKTVPLFFIISVISGLTSVGYNTSYNTLFYLNLPENANKDLFATFWNLTINVACFVGGAAGTWILSRFEAHGVYHILGLDFYGSQFLTSIKGLWYAMMIFYVFRNIRILQPKRPYE